MNARFHEEEAKIIAEAGVPGAVTIATNMAGRGTDIQLGGNRDMRLLDLEAKEAACYGCDADKIKKTVETDKKTALGAGGLYVICTERHEFA